MPVVVGIVERLAPDELWELFQRVVPEAPSRPQGGGRRRHGDREVLAAIVFVATSGCTRQQLPSASFGKGHAADPLPPGPRRRKPGKLHGDKGYDYSHLRRWLRERGITHRIARRGIETSQRLGRHCWTIERTMSWLAGCRRLHRRYERKAEHFLAFTGLACTFICLRRLAS
ncbi:transposase [Streptomyces xanthophaeus]|uniref:transposase n=1 Tax=Streptomyces xanthophaeus TaxID=67385 RepID=UPI00398FBB8B